MNDFDKQVDQALREWAAQFGGEELRRCGRVSFEHLRAPAANDDGPCDGIEKHVRRMAALGRWKEARVLQVEYCMQGVPEAERIAALTRLGIEISRASYYTYLSSARSFVAGAMSANDDPTNGTAESA